MVNLPAAWVFGPATAPYHPASAIMPELQSLLGTRFKLELRTDPLSLHGIGTDGPALLILYDDNWQDPLDLSALKAVKTWLRRGGRILMIHNGICWARRNDWFALSGGRFDGHADAKVLRYEAADGGEGFELFEEPYRYRSTWRGRRRVLGSYLDEGKRYPAWWWKPCGRGRLAHAQPGHDASSFSHPGCRAWLLKLVGVLGL